MALVHEQFLNCERNSGITDNHLNANYAARFVAGGDLDNGKPEVNLAGSAADANEVIGEIRGALNSATCTVLTRGMLKLRTDMTLTNGNAAVNQGVQAVGTGADVGKVEATGTLGTGFGRIVGASQEGTQVYLHVYVA